MSKTAIEWEEEGLSGVSSSGTIVEVSASRDAKGYYIRLETPVEDGEPVVTLFAISKETLGIVLAAIIRLTGLTIPGLGVIGIGDEI